MCTVSIQKNKCMSIHCALLANMRHETHNFEWVYKGPVGQVPIVSFRELDMIVMMFVFIFSDKVLDKIIKCVKEDKG